MTPDGVQPVTFVRAGSLLIARFDAEEEWVVYDAVECSMAVVAGEPPSLSPPSQPNGEQAS